MLEINGQIVVIRMPCLMEDEGNWHPLFVGESWDEVNDFVRDFTDSGEGYFKYHDLAFVGGLSLSGKNEFGIRRLMDYL